MISRKPLFAWVLERHRGLQMLLLLLIVAAIFLRVFPLEMQKRIVNSAIGLRNLNALYLYCGLYLGAVLLAGLFKYVINLLQGYIGQKILLRIRTELYDHILSLPLPFFGAPRRGWSLPRSLPNSAPSGIHGRGHRRAGHQRPDAGIVCGLHGLPRLTLAAVSFSIYPVEIVIIPFLQKRFNRLNRDRIEATRTMSNIIGEAVSGMHEIQGHAGYPSRIRSWDAVLPVCSRFVCA